MRTFRGELSVSISKNTPFVYIVTRLRLWAGLKVWNCRSRQIIAVPGGQLGGRERQYLKFIKNTLKTIASK
ncbi:hypothetical protein BpHYR1_045921 [Brachionus plicatilis]|uniref:Uncharacterized protein n=1 Tax=Brachionus plicatilis TaxID=10195 RepID=A0A3M7PIW8_BRAPC|nr:hypothetical protein BpHYR1_045921 [Brachionus plicatilis]